VAALAQALRGGGALERLDVSFNRLMPVGQAALNAAGDVVNCDIDIGDNYPRSDVDDDDEKEEDGNLGARERGQSRRDI
jgi:hypothetical protein